MKQVAKITIYGSPPRWRWCIHFGKNYYIGHVLETPYSARGSALHAAKRICERFGLRYVVKK